MAEIVAYCGIVCTECPAYLATQRNSDEDRERVAETWSKEYASDIKPEQINCGGCLPGHSLYFSHCAECDIRACGIAKGVENCAFCEDYACDKLVHFFGYAEVAKSKLDEIRAAF